jgi:hypothetical protein
VIQKSPQTTYTSGWERITAQNPTPVNWSSLLRVPIGVRRTSAARKALGFSPLVQAGWADASRLERVPLIAAGARPLALRGDQPRSGQRMRGLDGSRLLSCARSRSGIMPQVMVHVKVSQTHPFLLEQLVKLGMNLPLEVSGLSRKAIHETLQLVHVVVEFYGRSAACVLV